MYMCSFSVHPWIFDFIKILCIHLYIHQCFPDILYIYTSGWDNHPGCFSRVWMNGKSQGAWYYIICHIHCNLHMFINIYNSIEEKLFICIHRVEATILVASPWSGGMAKAKAQWYCIFCNIHCKMHIYFIVLYMYHFCKSIYIYLNMLYIRYIVCILGVETTILVFSPGPGGMAKAKARDIIL